MDFRRSKRRRKAVIRSVLRSDMVDLSNPFISASIILSLISSFPSSQVDSQGLKNCSIFSCGTVGNIRFPFYGTDSPECGIYLIECNDSIPTMRFEKSGRLFFVRSISYESKLLAIQADNIMKTSKAGICDALDNFTLPESPFMNFKLITPIYNFHRCKRNQSIQLPSSEFLYNYTECTDYDLYFTNETLLWPENNCTVFEIPVSDWIAQPYGFGGDLNVLLPAGIGLQWNLSEECEECFEKTGGYFTHNESTQQFNCSGTQLKKQGARNIAIPLKKTILGVCVGFGALLLFFSFLLVWWCRRNHGQHSPSPSSKLLPRAISTDTSFKGEIEKCYQTKFFSYEELEESTTKFDESKKLGDGGSCTVYHGILKDGRHVAVKRLHESKYRQFEQFKNEISILTRLNHQNLVTLYGCSSRHRRELLLVYEFIPNGTLADHLYGKHAKPGALTWSTRMNIAIETAEALRYLHAVDIVHRDVKASNILLSDGFRVKVVDFGLSRFFPLDVTHVSTAPLGTPGYIDPDYNRCYKLTSKSDVYSFGVVLIELISSKPAVDMNRGGHDINLAHMAIDRIKNKALNELVDPFLGFNSDSEVRRKMILTGELAFRCLRDEKEVRPSMEEVLEELKAIVDKKFQGEKGLDEILEEDTTRLT